jgi:hypothetical protein
MNEDEIRARTFDALQRALGTQEAALAIDALRNAGLQIVPAAKPACATEARGVYLGDDYR